MRQSNDLEWFSSQFQMNVLNNKSNFAVNQHKTKCGTTKTYNLERSNSLLGASDFRDFVLWVFFSLAKSFLGYLMLKRCTFAGAHHRTKTKANKPNWILTRDNFFEIIFSSEFSSAHENLTAKKPHSQRKTFLLGCTYKLLPTIQTIQNLFFGKTLVCKNVNFNYNSSIHSI